MSPSPSTSAVHSPRLDEVYQTANLNTNANTRNASHPMKSKNYTVVVSGAENIKINSPYSHIHSHVDSPSMKHKDERVHRNAMESMNQETLNNLLQPTYNTMTDMKSPLEEEHAYRPSPISLKDDYPTLYQTFNQR